MGLSFPHLLTDNWSELIDTAGAFVLQVLLLCTHRKCDKVILTNKETPYCLERHARFWNFKYFSQSAGILIFHRRIVVVLLHRNIPWKKGACFDCWAQEQANCFAFELHMWLHLLHTQFYTHTYCFRLYVSFEQWEFYATLSSVHML